MKRLLHSVLKVDDILLLSCFVVNLAALKDVVFKSVILCIIAAVQTTKFFHHLFYEKV